MHVGYVVVNNGANVIDISSEKLLYDQPIPLLDAFEIIKILREEGVTFYVKQDFRSSVSGGSIQPFVGDKQLQKAYMFHANEQYSSEKVDKIFKKLSHISDLALHKTRHKLPDKYGININHAKATKLHGVEVVMKKLDLKREYIVGVGDSYNDFPLLMACGFKVAMGNGIEELKAIADYVAPSVSDDGVAEVINKFIL